MTIIEGKTKLCKFSSTLYVFTSPFILKGKCLSLPGKSLNFLPNVYKKGVLPPGSDSLPLNNGMLNNVIKKEPTKPTYQKSQKNN